MSVDFFGFKNKLSGLKNKLSIIKVGTRNKQTREWQIKNKDRINANTHRYRARKKLAKGNHTEDDIKLLKQLQKNKCLCCGKKVTLTIDHIVPLAQGGRNDIINLQGLCLSCNSSKQNTTQDFRSKKLKKQIFKQFELF